MCNESPGSKGTPADSIFNPPPPRRREPQEVAADKITDLERQVAVMKERLADMGKEPALEPAEA
jgi:hypothetical protein